MADFDPTQMARFERAEWTGYYRRQWSLVLAASLALVREAFRLSWPQTIRGAWFVLRANQRWAPYPDNDADGARRHMARFYAIVAARPGAEFDAVEAARLEVEWWRVHRERQRGDGAGSDDLVEALARLYGHVHGADPKTMRDAALHRALAMDVCDRWVAAGCQRASPLLRDLGTELVRSYVALRVAAG